MAMAAVPAASPMGAHRSPTKTPMQPNVTNVVLGNLHIKPWYPSFYPEDLVGGKKTDWLYVCPWCFRYTAEIVKFTAHCKVCPLRAEAPPGDVVYDSNEYVIHQLDGEECKLYAQNLSLFSKLFLDTKSVFFDVGTFLYYTLVMRTASTHPYGQVVGFFSKEKMSWDNNNLACILVFPPWQRKGFGQILIAASYEMGRREKRFGGPERPLSTLGRKGYIAFWAGEIYRFILITSPKKTITLQDISDATYVAKEDLVAALLEMDVLENRKTPSGSCVMNKSQIREWATTHHVSDKPVIDADAFVGFDVEGDESDQDELLEDSSDGT